LVIDACLHASEKELRLGQMVLESGDSSIAATAIEALGSTIQAMIDTAADAGYYLAGTIDPDDAAAIATVAAGTAVYRQVFQVHQMHCFMQSLDADSLEMAPPFSANWSRWLLRFGSLAHVQCFCSASSSPSYLYHTSSRAPSVTQPPQLHWHPRRLQDAQLHQLQSCLLTLEEAASRWVIHPLVSKVVCLCNPHPAELNGFLFRPLWFNVLNSDLYSQGARSAGNSSLSTRFTHVQRCFG
jgi:hypothetical protein